MTSSDGRDEFGRGADHEPATLGTVRAAFDASVRSATTADIEIERELERLRRILSHLDERVEALERAAL